MKKILRVAALCLALWPAGLLGACSDAGLPADDIAAARTALARHEDMQRIADAGRLDMARRMSAEENADEGE